MRIELGETTRRHMTTLEIEEFPFTSAELKTKFRILVKQEHPDTSGKESNEKTRKIIEAYNHLKNLVQENIDIEAPPINDDDEEDIFNLTERCPSCKGKGVVTERVWVDTPGECMVCGGTGRVPIKCKFCESGKFKTRSGRIVECRVCKGTSIWRTKPCKCRGEGPHSRFFDLAAVFRMLSGIYIHKAPGHYETRTITCLKCNGRRKVKLNPFNPVIPKGAVLKPK